MKTGVKKSLLCLCFCTLIACMWGVATTLTTPAPAYADSLVSSDMTMFKGAEVLLGEVSGLRFGYKVDNYDESKNYGMLIVPYDYLETVGITDLTDGENDYVNALNAAELPHEPIIVENLKANSSGEIRYSISNLIENNYARKFFGLGFEKTGENTYLYATQDDNARTVFEVANKAVNKLNFYDWY